MIFSAATGQGNRALVFIHGLACAHADWCFQVAHFESRYRCIAVDLRGHGRSVDLPGPYEPRRLAADVVELARMQGLEAIIPIGHSMGCRVVLETCLQAPDLVKAAVLVDGSRRGFGNPDEAKQQIEAALARTPFSRVAGALFEQMFIGASDTEDKAAIIERAKGMPERIGAELIAEMEAWDAGVLETALERIKVPIGVSQSTYTRADKTRTVMRAGVSSPWLDLLRERCSEVDIDVVPEVGHFTMLEAPDRVNATIERIARKVGL